LLPLKNTLLKKLLLNIFYLFFACSGFGQIAGNLVPNYSFEQHDTCPSDQGQITYAIGWSSSGNTPDYFNACATYYDFSVPYNWGGYKQAATGNAYCGIGTYCTCGANGREFMIAPLTTPLIIGNTYFVSFKTSLSISDSICANCATNKIGALFSMIYYDYNNTAPINNFAQIYTNTRTYP